MKKELPTHCQAGTGVHPCGSPVPLSLQVPGTVGGWEFRPLLCRGRQAAGARRVAGSLASRAASQVQSGRHSPGAACTSAGPSTWQLWRLFVSGTRRWGSALFSGAG